MVEPLRVRKYLPPGRHVDDQDSFSCQRSILGQHVASKVTETDLYLFEPHLEQSFLDRLDRMEWRWGGIDEIEEIVGGDLDVDGGHGGVGSGSRRTSQYPAQEHVLYGVLDGRGHRDMSSMEYCEC